MGHTGQTLMAGGVALEIGGKRKYGWEKSPVEENPDFANHCLAQIWRQDIGVGTYRQVSRRVIWRGNELTSQLDRLRILA
jgi:hypothetical protein